MSEIKVKVLIAIDVGGKGVEDVRVYRTDYESATKESIERTIEDWEDMGLDVVDHDTILREE